MYAFIGFYSYETFMQILSNRLSLKEKSSKESH